MVRKEVNDMLKYSLHYARYVLAALATVAFKITVN